MRTQYMFCQSIPLEQLISKIKSHFKISSDETINYIDVNIGIGLIPSLTSDFWEVSTESTPVYRVKTRNSKKI